MSDTPQEIEQQAEALPTETTSVTGSISGTTLTVTAVGSGVLQVGTIAQVEETAQEIVAEAKQADAAPPTDADGDIGHGAHAAHAILDQIDALAGKVQAYADQGHAVAVTRQLRDLVAQARAAL